MDELHAACDKLFTDVDHLERAMDCDDLDSGRILLALAAAKRVRRESTIVVRHLASLRDQLQPSGGTS